jgi:tRNA dimethylallyltransferase
MGPTASGKTGLAMRLRELYPFDLISVDSAQVYRGMDIGTAKPDPQTLEAAPHALIDILGPTQPYSAADFRSDALLEIERICNNGRVPLLVGGTMLYFRALQQGLATLPPANARVRKRLELEAAEVGWPEMHRRLAETDPQTASRLHPNDAQRIQRALEVAEVTGRPLSELQAAASQPDFEYQTLKIVLCPSERSVLHQRIADRFDQMLEEGLVAELKGLRERFELDSSMPSMRCVGYRQVWEMLEGRFTPLEMKEKAVAATRQLAKRQLTWLRQETGALWYDLEENGAEKSILNEVAKFLEK